MANGMEPLVLALLVIESALIVLTIVLIALSRREASSRVELLDHLVATAEALSRREYFAVSTEGIQDAEDAVAGMVTGSRPRSGDKPVIDRILRAVGHAVDRGVQVRYLLPMGRDRLAMGHRYEQAGADVRYHPGLLAGDARFMVADGQDVVLGFPEDGGEDRPTRSGKRIHSEKVGQLFLADFEQHWDAEATCTLDAYLHDVVGDLIAADPRTSPARIAANLGVPEARIEAVLPKIRAQA